MNTDLNSNDGNSAPKKAETKPASRGLGSWLQKNGLTPRKTTDKPENVTKSPAKSEDRPSKDKNTETKRPFKPRNGKAGRGRIMVTNHNPLADKHTHTARDAQHITNKMLKNAGDIRVIPMGGVEQVGMNMMFIEWGDEILVIDCGLLFPDPEHLGIDILAPDTRYLAKNKHKIKGVVFTHGHLDHIGAVGLIMKDLGYPPLYATRLTKELIFSNAAEYGVNKFLNVKEITPKSKIKLGKFAVEFFHINHSIPDGVGIVVKTPYGNIVHTSDFKIDHNPSDDQPSDLHRIAEIGKEGVVLAMVDSTNAMKPGHTKSEHIVQNEIDNIIKKTTGRLIITTFASSIGRIAKIVESAEKHGRTVFMSGRSMENNLGIARKLNYLKCKDRTLRKMHSDATKMPGRKVLILSTGSQGEELASLTRMAAGKHRDVKLKKTDTIIFSSSPIPGNETAIVKVRNNLSEIGLTTIDHTQSDVYVSGHGYQDELITMTSLLNPKNFAPIHGELYMRHGHRDLVVDTLGMKPERCFIMKNGQGVIINGKGTRLMNENEKIHMTTQMFEFGRRVPHKIIEDRTKMGESGCIIIKIDHKKGNIDRFELRNHGDCRLRKGNKLYSAIESEVRETFEKMFDSSKENGAMERLLAGKARKLLYERGKPEPIVEVFVN